MTSDHKKKRVLLCARHSTVEPLGLLYLSRVAKEQGWESKIDLFENMNIEKLDKTIQSFKPDLVGFSVYTGNHVQMGRYLRRLKRKHPNIETVIGGPHPTYFPEEAAEQADYVVISEGFHSFKSILRGEAKKGILAFTKQDPFPVSEREPFYRDSIGHKQSPIKSIITGTGCPYACTYCFNSSTLDGIMGALTPEQYSQMSTVVGKSGRLFPKARRPVDDIIEEARNIMELAPETKMIFFQDDVFGTNLKWLKEFSEKFPQLDLPFHGLMRFEYANPDKDSSRQRIDLLKEAGCTGLTFAIEAADPVIREEVLNRRMDNELMFKTFEYINGLGFKVRTQQMLGLPYGATTKPTKINLEADLELLDLNIKLFEETGLPTYSWASIFAPYMKTKLGDYCQEQGFYEGKDNDVPDNFFDKSVLRFPKRWVGPNLSSDSTEWLEPAELEKYHNQMVALRDTFYDLVRTPRGGEIARKFLEKGDFSLAGFSRALKNHTYNTQMYGIK